MALSLAVNGNTINAIDVNALVNILQQPSGGQEKGKYHQSGNSYITGGYVGIYLPSLSRNSVPVSASIDTADVAPAGLNTPTTTQLTSGGFQVHSSSTGIAASCNAAGNFTLQY